MSVRDHLRMLQKVIGSLLGLVLAGFGVALLGGWFDVTELDTDGGGRRSRSLKRMVSWLTDTLGPTGAGALLIAVGAALVFFALRKGGDKGQKKAA